MNTILQKRIEEAAIKVSDVCEPCDYGDPFCASCHRPYMYDSAKKMGEVILNNQWVSVEEALPEEKFNDGYQFVFVRIHLYDDTFYYDTDYIKKGKWELHKNQKITHWMEIPSLEGGEK